MPYLQNHELTSHLHEEVMEEIDSAKKAGDINEDDQHKKREQVQENVNSTNQTLENLFEQKEKAITTI
jgi:ribosome recycling factor